MKKILIASLSVILGLTIAGCKGKTTTKKNNSSTKTKTSSTTTTKTSTTQTKEKSYRKSGDSIYFGKYPQTLIENNAIIDELNRDCGSWTSFKYYVDGLVDDYMYYTDMDVNHDGTYDYRGVYFTSYRPYLTNTVSAKDLTYQDENLYEANKVYWFAYEDIKWDILSENEEEILVVADLILDSQEMYHKIESNKFDHNDGNGYANNYALSNIRKWLNDSFYNTAFNELEKEDIKTSFVHAGSDPSKYVYDTTEDNVFLLSKGEVSTYFLTDEEREAVGTSYAQIQGLYVESSIVNTGNSYWWVRTPSYNSDFNTSFIYRDGSIDGNGENVNKTCIGVRPAIRLYV